MPDQDYTQHERDVLANMLMRSLRGNWRNYEERARMLIELAEDGLYQYEDEAVKSRAENMLEKQHPDGRTFRYIYEDGPKLPEQTNEEIAKELARDLPRADMSFSRSDIERRFEDDD